MFGREEYMNKRTLNRLSANYTCKSSDLGDRLFFVCLWFFRTIVDITAYFFLATVHTFVPALFFTWLVLKITPLPGVVKVFLVALLTLGYCFLLASLLDPFFRQMRARKENLSRAIDAWIDAERVQHHKNQSNLTRKRQSPQRKNRSSA